MRSLHTAGRVAHLGAHLSAGMRDGATSMCNRILQIPQCSLHRFDSGLGRQIDAIATLRAGALGPSDARAHQCAQQTVPHRLRVVPALVRLVTLASVALFSDALPAQVPSETPSGSLRRTLPDSVAQADVAFVLSGEISNGSYQAGVLWSLLTVMRTANEGRLDSVDLRRRFSVIAATGASAGSINSLSVPLTWCDSATSTEPVSTSIQWSSWIPVGLSQLLSPKDSASGAAFSRRYIESRLLPGVKERLGQVRCQKAMLVGLTLTRETPIHMKLARGLIDVPIQRMVSVFSFDSAGMHHATDTTGRGPEMGLSMRVDSEPEEAAVKVALASSAFPGAFAAVELSYTRPHSRARVSARFLDGGVFENNPIPLTKALLDSGASTRDDNLWVIPVSGGFRPAEVASTGTSGSSPNDGENRSNGSASSDESRASGLASVATFFAGAVPSGRAYELSFMLRSESGANWLSRLAPPTRYERTFGSRLGGFGAFLSRSFREYDFIAGIADGLRFAVSHWTCADSVGREGQCVSVDGLATRSYGLARALPQLANDSIVLGALRTMLTPSVDTTTRRGLRSRTFRYYASATTAFDSVIDSKSCGSDEQGFVCASGLFGVLDGFPAGLRSDVGAASKACKWDSNALAWEKPAACRDSGFFESMTEGATYLDINELMDKPTSAIDRLIDDAAVSIYRGTSKELRARMRGAWWVGRSLSSSQNAVTLNPTLALGRNRLLRRLTPHRFEALFPVSATGDEVTVRAMYSPEGGKPSDVAVQFPFGIECTSGSRCTAVLQFGARKATGGIGFEGGLAWRSSPSRELWQLSRIHAPFKSQALYFRINVLNALALGYEHSESRVGDPRSYRGRLSVGLYDLTGLFWLITGH
jgi:predicted acylesterase/phospholipase RssA